VSHIVVPSMDPRNDRRTGTPEGLARRVAELERRLGAFEGRQRHGAPFSISPTISTSSPLIATSDALIPDMAVTFTASGRRLFVSWYATALNDAGGSTKAVAGYARLNGTMQLGVNSAVFPTVSLIGASNFAELHQSLLIDPSPGSVTIDVYGYATAANAGWWQLKRNLTVIEL
jgi:hypothetical protein